MKAFYDYLVENSKPDHTSLLESVLDEDLPTYLGDHPEMVRHMDRWGGTKSFIYTNPEHDVQSVMAHDPERGNSYHIRIAVGGNYSWRK